MIARRRSKILLPVALAAVLAIALLAIPSVGSGAYWTDTATGSAGTVGAGQWCATPDPAVSGARFVRLSDISTLVSGSTTQRIAIIPVSNNTAWGGGTSAATLAVRLWGCQTGSTMPTGTLRVTSWANPGTGSLPAATFLAGSTAAPATRLNPASALGTQLSNLATAANVDGSTVLLSASDARRFSWLLSSGRTLVAPTVAPAPCTYLLAALALCALPLGPDQQYSAVFNTSAFTGTGPTGAAYAAQTYAVQSASGWGTLLASFNQSCVLLSCTQVAAPTSMTATTNTTLTSTNGNILQWVVITWTGTTAPPPDLEVEVFLQ
jgi:hypothetical protein